MGLEAGHRGEEGGTPFWLLFHALGVTFRSRLIQRAFLADRHSLSQEYCTPRTKAKLASPAVCP